MKKITFIPLYNDFPEKGNVQLPAPKPASLYIPEWYAKSERYLDGDKKPALRSDFSSNSGLKTCVPFLDCFMTGYVMETWVDIQVKKISEDNVIISWAHGPDPVLEREKQLGALIPRPAGHHDNHFAWRTQWGVKIQRGYSILMTHPLNRFDLPFTTLSGIVDADQFSNNGNLPFFIKKDFEGLIPAGTPFAQIIPIKREGWKSEEPSKEDIKEATQNAYDTKRVISGFYKNFKWIKKDYK